MNSTGWLRYHRVECLKHLGWTVVSSRGSGLVGEPGTGRVLSIAAAAKEAGLPTGLRDSVLATETERWLEQRKRCPR